LRQDDQNNLTKGIETCLEAATYEFNTEIQKHLLKCAAFAKCFVSYLDFDSNAFVKNIKFLRILNQVRTPKVKCIYQNV
jgi:vacuolar protein sorting-associated protein 16